MTQKHIKITLEIAPGNEEENTRRLAEYFEESLQSLHLINEEVPQGVNASLVLKLPGKVMAFNGFWNSTNATGFGEPDYGNIPHAPIDLFSDYGFRTVISGSTVTITKKNGANCFVTGIVQYLKGIDQ